jgi:hypothetical protein
MHNGHFNSKKNISVNKYAYIRFDFKHGIFTSICSSEVIVSCGVIEGIKIQKQNTSMILFSFFVI